MHRVLERQIRKYLGDPAELPANCQTFLKVVNDLFEHFEKDRSMLERSIELSSQEMIELNTKLRKESAELQKAHQELSKAHHELSTLFENIDDIIFSVDMVEHKTLQMSPACMKIYGYTPEDFHNNPNLWYEVILDEDKPVVQANYKVMHSGQSFSQEYRIICKDGTIKWLESKITPALDARSMLVRIDGISTDITSRKEAEAKIQYSESRFRHLIEKSHDGIALLGPERKLVYVTPSVKRILGYDHDELIGTDPAIYTHPDDLEEVTQLLGKLIPRYGETEHAVYRMKNKAGAWRWISSNITNMLHEPGIRAIVFNYEDISKRVKAETQLEFDRRNRDALINSTTDLMWSMDKDMRLITANNAFIQAIKTLSGAELKPGDSVVNISGFPKAGNKKWAARYDRALNGETFTIEERYTTGDLESWSEITFHPIREYNRVIGASCFSRDITQNKNTLKLIKKSEKLMAEAERIAHLGSWEYEMASPEQTLRWSNEVFRIFGHIPGSYEPSFEGFLGAVHPDDKKMVADIVQYAIETFLPFNVEFRIVRPNSTVRWVRGSGKVLFNKKTRKVHKMIGTAQDITKRKLIEEERHKITNDLIQRNKALEQFTYIVSHNLRAPVANIRGLTSIVQTHSLDEQSYATCMKGLESAATRLDDVIVDLNNILQIKKQINETKENVKFSDIVSNIKDTTQNLLDQGNVTIKTDFSSYDEMFTIKSYLHSIFYNLISNSIKYRKPNESPVIEIKSLTNNGKNYLIFKDNCMGIDLGLHGDKVFGLYKRFHLNIEGKGMGLFMVKTQVEALGGNVTLKSEVDKGTEFVLEFS